MQLVDGQHLTFKFPHHTTGDMETRRIVVSRLFWGKTPHYPDKNRWVLVGYDLDKNAERYFVMDHVEFISIDTEETYSL